MLTKEQEKKEFARRRKQFEDFLHSPEYQEKLLLRAQLRDAGDRDFQSRAYIWRLCEREDNPIEGCKFFVNNFGWTLDPRPEHYPHNLPFITFPYQDKTIEWLINHINGSRDGLIEKSRDMGASWLVFIYVPLWYWLFRDGTNFLLGSYKEMLVDDKTNDSLFGKIDYALRNLPSWLLPAKFKPDKHRTKLKLINPSNHNQITGDTMNPDFGRGSRKTAVLFDELGSWDYAKDAWESCGDSTSCRIANSTPKGYNFFADLRENSGIDVLTLLWKDHPLKDQTWYEFECARRTDEEVAQEIDISYVKSREGKVYPEWGEPNVMTGLYEYDPDAPLFVSWDFGKSDDTAIIWAQPDFKSGMLKIIDTYRNKGKNIDFYVPFVTGIIPGGQYQYNSDDLAVVDEHREWKRATHFGDPAGRFRNQVVDQTVIDVLRQYGIVVNFKEQWKDFQGFQGRRSAGKRLIMDGIKLNDNERTRYFSLCMINSSYPKVRREGTEEFNTQKPKHDQYSHYRTAFEYLAMGLKDVTHKRREPVDKFPPKSSGASGRVSPLRFKNKNVTGY